MNDNRNSAAAKRKTLKAFVMKNRKELIMTLALLVIAIAALIVINLTRVDGSYAEVRVNDRLTGTYPLSDDGEFSLNGGTNILVIKDGYAYLSEANCPDHTCVNTGKIKRTGESIICLPNKLSVIIRGEKSEDDPDLVS